MGRRSGEGSREQLVQHRPTQPSRRPRTRNQQCKDAVGHKGSQPSCSASVAHPKLLHRECCPLLGSVWLAEIQGNLVRLKTSAFWGSKSYIGALKRGDFPYLSQWTSQGLFPPRARLLRLLVPSEGSLGGEEQGQAQEPSLKDREMRRSLGPVTNCEICQHFI